MRLIFSFILILLMMSFNDGGSAHINETSVRVSIDLPLADGTTVLVYLSGYRESTQVTGKIANHHCELLIKNPLEGVYNIEIVIERTEYNSRDLTRNKDGEIIEEIFSHPLRAAFSMYINPAQDRHYAIHLTSEIDEREIATYAIAGDFYRRDKFPLTVSSNSEDNMLFSELVAFGAKHRTNHSIIQDSLYKNRTEQKKLITDFYDQALALNKPFKQSYDLQKLEFMRQHLENPIAIYALMYNNDETLLIYGNEYQQLLNQISVRHQKNPQYLRAQDRLTGLLHLNIGNVLPMPYGKTPAGSSPDFSYSDAEFTLVEFWASWCKPCRIMNPQWNDLLGKYKADQKLQILGVSVDKNQADWESAIEDDLLGGWIHISDLMDPDGGDNSNKYGIAVIPYNILVDRQDRITHKNIKPDALEKLISENLN